MLLVDNLLYPFDKFDKTVMSSIASLNISEDKVRLVSYFVYILNSLLAILHPICFNF